MSLYMIALLTHIIATLVLFMAIGVEWLCLRRFRGAGTTEQLREWGSLTTIISKPLPLSVLLILGSGLYLTATAWGWNVPWINLSLASVLAMSAVGVLVNSRRLEAIAAAARTAAPGAIPPDLVRQIQDPILSASIQTSATLAFGVVFLMVVKPDLIGSLTALAISVAIGVLSAQWGTRREGLKPAAIEAAAPHGSN